MAAIRPLLEIDGRGLSSSAQFRNEVVEPCVPVVMRGLVEGWPAVNSATRSAEDLQQYLTRFDNGGEADAFVGDPMIAGKYYYTHDLKGFNFERRRMRLADALAAIVATRGKPGSPTMYVGSVPINDFLPGFTAQNVLQVLPPHVVPRIWLGHPSNVSAPLRCIRPTLPASWPEPAASRFIHRRPSRVSTWGLSIIRWRGQPVSLAASAPADDERYPKFSRVREQALSAELGAGDAIYIPKLWWHQIESTAPFNALVNYWWDAFAEGPDAPYTGLLLSMIAIAERPPAERQAWKAFFDHYVFSEPRPIRWPTYPAISMAF